MPTRTWQHSERQIARLLGLRRVGNTGASTPDAMGAHLVAEVKHRRKRTFPRWVHDALTKIRGHAGATRLGLLVLHTEGQPYGESLVVLTLQDFCDWYVSPADASDQDADGAPAGEGAP